ncbi:MAG TPA: hypothetical protein VJV78_17520 [Polyangiales bacterium]|nr:hypothetical protein [Polyangiales bacterium]
MRISPRSVHQLPTALKSRLHPTIAATDEAIYAAALEYARALD